MSYQQKIIKHYEEVWESKSFVYLWDKGPIEELPYDFRILEFPPNSKRNMWTYATCCMSKASDNIPLELHIFSSIQDHGLVELLTMVGYYHSKTSKIGLNDTINFGKSWQKNSLCEYGFVSLPYLDGPALENLRLSSDILIKCFWLIPITKGEKDFKTERGADSLEDLFEHKKINYLDTNRISMI